VKDWIDYYDSTHTIYANARHRDVHFETLADDIKRHIPSPDAVVLDYCCGEALAAGRVAASCGKLVLAEPAPGVRERLVRLYDAHPNIDVIAPDKLADRAADSVDVAVMVSVAQYMTPAELSAALAAIRRVLKPAGCFVIGDVIPPDAGMVSDVTALLRFGAAHGFFWAALAGIVRTALSDYRRLRTTIGLARYGEAEMIVILQKAGFDARRAADNIGHNPARMTFVATPRGEA
jgi:SAM-dependent methyltransferase